MPLFARSNVTRALVPRPSLATLLSTTHSVAAADRRDPVSYRTEFPKWCATNAEGGVGVEDRTLVDACCIRDVGGPYGAALQGEAPNHRELRRSRAGVVSVAEKAHQQCVRCEPRRRTRVNH